MFLLPLLLLGFVSTLFHTTPHSPRRQCNSNFCKGFFHRQLSRIKQIVYEGAWTTSERRFIKMCPVKEKAWCPISSFYCSDNEVDNSTKIFFYIILSILKYKNGQHFISDNIFEEQSRKQWKNKRILLYYVNQFLRGITNAWRQFSTSSQLAFFDQNSIFDPRAW